jgi:hypothetical protein
MPNHLGVYGTPETIRIHEDEQVKYPTEVQACAHIYNPADARFIPAPVGPLRVWCCGCQRLQPVEAFHRHSKRSNGYQSFCKACQKAHRKAKRLKKGTDEHWYRTPNVSHVSSVKEKL